MEGGTQPTGLSAMESSVDLMDFHTNADISHQFCSRSDEQLAESNLRDSSSQLSSPNTSTFVFAHANAPPPQSSSQSSSSVRSPPAVVTNAAATTTPTPRLRKYFREAKGPYIVIIREKSVKLRPVSFSKYINETYNSTEVIKSSPGKMKIVLQSLQQANALAADATFDGYTVSIPADRVEIEGAINANDLFDLENMQFLMDNGTGVFGNHALPPCKIIHAERLFRTVSNASNNRVQEKVLTDTVKLVFEGQILPSFIVVEGLRVRVRPFHSKPMFCDRCQKFGHTNKFCKRQAKCAKCSGGHLTSSCNSRDSAQPSCQFCQSPQQHANSECAFFAEVNASYKERQSIRRQTRLRMAITSANARHEEPNLCVHDAVEFPPLANRFSSLNEDPVSQPAPATESDIVTVNHINSATTSRPSNPYAKKLPVNRPKIRARSASKRRLDSSIKSPPKSNVPPCNVQQIAQPTAAPTTSRQSSLHESASPTAGLKSVIIALARNANISDVWLNLLELVLDPLLQAILPMLPALIGALSPLVHGSSR